MTGDGKRGQFIAFEGGEGAGKTTQARLLFDALTRQGIAAEMTREPGGTPGAEAIRELLLHPPHGPEAKGWPPQAEALLFAAARCDHVVHRILPALESGKWIICDRFVDSSRAYQGGAGGLGDEAILSLHRFGSGGIRPDLTILIEADADRLAERLARRDGTSSDAIGGRDAAYHRQVAATFRDNAAGAADVVVIDGSGDPQAVHTAVMRAVQPLVESESR